MGWSLLFPELLSGALFLCPWLELRTTCDKPGVYVPHHGSFCSFFRCLFLLFVLSLSRTFTEICMDYGLRFSSVFKKTSTCPKILSIYFDISGLNFTTLSIFKKTLTVTILESILNY